MKRILFVKSSLNGDHSASARLARELIAELEERHPGSSVTTLDLERLALPHLGAAEFQSWTVPLEQRDSEQIEMTACSDRLIAQLLAHDTLVLAIPMYNMGVPSTLKVWIDRIVRAGRTFRYTDSGPQGLVHGIDAYAVFARGGAYRGTPLDIQTGYVNAVLGLIGINNIKCVFAEGLAMGDESRDRAFNEAREAIASLVHQFTNAEVRYVNS